MTKFHKLLALVLALTLTASLFACSQKDSGGNSSSKSTKSSSIPPVEPGSASRVYIIATDTDFAPFEFTDSSGEMTGIDIDLLDAIAEDQGFRYEIEPLGFSAAVAALETKQVDGVLAGMSITEARRGKYDFSDPYFDSQVAMGVAQDNNDVKSYTDLKGKTVAVKTGTEGEALADKLKGEYGFTTISFDSSSDMYADVKAGNADACFEDYPALNYAVGKNIGLKIVGERRQGSSYGFAVAKDENAELLDLFNKGLKNVRDSGRYDEILDAYIKK